MFTFTFYPSTNQTLHHGSESHTNRSFPINGKRLCYRFYTLSYRTNLLQIQNENEKSPHESIKDVRIRILLFYKTKFGTHTKNVVAYTQIPIHIIKPNTDNNFSKIAGGVRTKTSAFTEKQGLLQINHLCYASKLNCLISHLR